MGVYKVIARNPKTGRQEIKKVYETEDKYNKYGKITAERYRELHDVEVYIMHPVTEEYELVLTMKKPRTIEEARAFKEERGYSETWLKYYINRYL